MSDEPTAPALPTITLPRLERESPRAYAARVEYVTMGPKRSLEVLTQKWSKSRSLVGRWSTQYDWVEHARQYDDQVAYLTVQAAASAYREHVEEHRKRYGETGKKLHAAAVNMLGLIVQAMRGVEIEGKDGKTYTIPRMKVESGSLTTVARALTIAADLEAHALRLDELLPRLTDAEPDRE